MLIYPKDVSSSLPKPLLTHEEFQALLHGIFPLSVLPFHSNQSEHTSQLSNRGYADMPLNKPLEGPSSTSGSVGLL